MHIHLHSPADETLFALTPAQWQAALARSGADAAGLHATFGADDASFADAMRTAEALICDPAVILRQRDGAGAPLAAPHLKLVLATSAGLDRLAPYGWLPAGAALLNNRGTHGAKASEFALMALLMLASGIPAMVTDQREGRWQKRWGHVLAGRRLTVIGLGTLGGGAAALAAGHGMVITGVRANPAPHPACAQVVDTAALDSVLAETDMLLIACPLTPATRGLISRARLGLLPRGAGVVNIGRGPVLDQDALCDALESGHLSGAVLDVFDPEPVPPGHRLWQVPNLIISPHTSADDPATYNAISLDIFFANLAAWRAGQPLPNRFDPARGY